MKKQQKLENVKGFEKLSKKEEKNTVGGARAIGYVAYRIAAWYYGVEWKEY